MISDFIKAAEDKVDRDRIERWTKYQLYSEQKKSYIVEIYKKYFPLLCENIDLMQGESVWLAKGEYNPKVEYSRYGSSGILVNGYIFSVYGSSYGSAFLVAEYKGEGVAIDDKDYFRAHTGEIDYDERLAQWFKQVR